jgi:hypothetical protein
MAQAGMFMAVDLPWGLLLPDDQMSLQPCHHRKPDFPTPVPSEDAKRAKVELRPRNLMLSPRTGSTAEPVDLKHTYVQVRFTIKNEFRQYLTYDTAEFEPMT